MTAQIERRALSVADIYDANDEERRLLFVTSAMYRRILADIHLLVTEAFDLDPATFRLPDSATTALLGEAADRVVGISQTTREAIAAKLQAGQDAGLTTQEIADSIESLFSVTWAGRAETIVRSEVGHAQRMSSLDRYRASGMVDRVRIRDGEDDEPCKSRNGTTVPIDEAPDLAHPNCLVGGQVVFAPNVETAFARWFEGEVIVLRTAANDLLTCTPNHPILTGRGWVGAGDVREGDDVLRSGDGERVAGLLDPDHEHRPTLIEDVADALWPPGCGSTTPMPGSPVDFHGDGMEGNVHVIRADRPDWDSVDRQHVQQQALALTLMCARALLAKRDTAAMLERLVTPAHRFMRGGGDRLAELGRALRIEQVGGLTAAPDRPPAPLPRPQQVREVYAGVGGDCGGGFSGEVAVVERPIAGVVAPLQALLMRGDGPSELMECLTQYLGVDADGRRDMAQRLAGLVTPTRITQVLSRPFAGHVYNLQTKQGWYVAENIITHNCTLVLIPILRGDPA